MTNPAGIDLATGEGVFVSTHGGGDLSLMLEVVCGRLPCRVCNKRSTSFRASAALGTPSSAKLAGLPDWLKGGGR